MQLRKSINQFCFLTNTKLKNPKKCGNKHWRQYALRVYFAVFGAHPHTPLSLAAASRRHELPYGQDTACRGGYAKEISRHPNETTAGKYVSFTSGHNQFLNPL